MDAIQEWENAVGRKMQAGMNRQRAIKSVVHENPKLHARYVVAHNEKHGRDGAARNYASICGVDPNGGM